MLVLIRVTKNRNGDIQQTLIFVELVLRKSLFLMQALGLGPSAYGVGASLLTRTTFHFSKI